MLLNIATFISFILGVAILGRALFEQDILTRILLINSGTTVMALFLCFLGSYSLNSSYIDIAMIYFLLTIVASCADLRFFSPRQGPK